MSLRNKALSSWATTQEQTSSSGTVYDTTRGRNFKAVSEAARGRWPEILAHIGVPPEFLSRRHGPCPFCGGKDRYRFVDKDGSGSYFCNQCRPGDGFQLVQNFTGCSPTESKRMVDDIVDLRAISIPVRPITRGSVSTTSDAAPVVDEAIRRANEKLWAASEPVSGGDPVDSYLRHIRRLSLATIPEGLRYHKNMAYYNEQGALVGYFPAMLAQVVNAAGQVVALHKTFLNTDGTKATVPKVKKLSRVVYSGALSGSGIRLFEAGPTLAVCEGVETALAVSLLSDEPAWAAVSAHGLESLEVPPVVQHLLICADNDDRGLQAAKRLAARQVARGVTCQILIPEPAGADWADVAFIEV